MGDALLAQASEQGATATVDTISSLTKRTWKHKGNLLGPLLNIDQIRQTRRLQGRFALGK